MTFSKPHTSCYNPAAGCPTVAITTTSTATATSTPCCVSSRASSTVRSILLLVTVSIAWAAQPATAQSLPATIQAVMFDFMSYDGTTFYNNVSADAAHYALHHREMYAGMAAAFKEANDAGGAHGRLFELLHIEAPNEDNPNGDNGVGLLAAGLAARPNVMAVLGGSTSTAPGAFYVTQAVGMAQIGADNMLPEMLNTSLGGRHALNIRLPFDIDTQLMLQYMLQSRLRCRNIAVLYFQGYDEVRRLAEGLVATLASLDYPARQSVPIPQDFVSSQGWTDNVTAALRPGDFAERAQCVVILHDTAGLVNTIDLLVRSIQNFSIADYAIFTPSVVSSADWRSVPGFSAGYFDNLYSVTQIPNPYDTRYSVVNSYRRAMAALHATGYPADTIASVQGLTSPARWRRAQPGIDGYVTARLFIEIVRRTSPNNFTRAALIDTAYRTKTFAIDDFILGFYNAECEGVMQQARTMPCGCNSGTRSLFMTKVNTSAGVADPIYNNESAFEVGIAEVHLPPAVCAVADVTATIALTAPSIHAVLIGSNLSAGLGSQRCRCRRCTSPLPSSKRLALAARSTLISLTTPPLRVWPLIATSSRTFCHRLFELRATLALPFPI